LGSTLTFWNQTITIDPGDYQGKYVVSGGAAGGGWISGVRNVVVVPDLQDYDLVFYGPSPTITFDIDASGNVSSDRPTSAFGTDAYGDQIDETLRFNNVQITIDPGAYDGQFLLTGGITGGGWLSGVHDVWVVPDMQSYDLQLNGVGYITFDIDADGNVISDQPASAVGSGSTLTLENRIITIDPGGYSGGFSVEAGYLLPQSTDVAEVIVVPGLDGYTINVVDGGNHDFDVDANGDPVPSSIDVTVGQDVYTFLLSQVTNSPPTAVAGGPYTGAEGSPITFDASASSDPDNDPLQYRWDFNGDGTWDTAYSADPTAEYTWPDDYSGSVIVEVSDGQATDTDTTTVTVNNVAPNLGNATFTIEENTPNGTLVGSVTGTDPGTDTLTYSITGGSGETAFAIDSETGAITVADQTQLDFEDTPNLTVEMQVADDDGGTGTATMTIDLLNQASITGVVFVDVNQNGLYDANEPGIDGVVIELLDEFGAAVLDDLGNPITATTTGGGFYLFEDLDIGTYQLHEIQPSGVDDGAELLGSLGGTIPANDTMQLAIERTDATDYVFAELGQQVTSGDTATIGFWHNKHGQALITQGGTALAQWLSANFDNVFGDEFVGAGGSDVAQFFNDQLFKQKGKKSNGPAKVDAQFMAVALATYFTSSNLAGNVAGDYGFNVTDTGIGTRVVNVGSGGAAFSVANDTDVTIMQLLQATNALTDLPDGISGFAHIYDQDGDGQIDEFEALLRVMANDVYSTINEQGDI